MCETLGFDPTIPVLKNKIKIYWLKPDIFIQVLWIQEPRKKINLMVATGKRTMWERSFSFTVFIISRSFVVVVVQFGLVWRPYLAVLRGLFWLVLRSYPQQSSEDYMQCRHSRGLVRHKTSTETPELSPINPSPDPLPTGMDYGINAMLNIQLCSYFHFINMIPNYKSSPICSSLTSQLCSSVLFSLLWLYWSPISLNAAGGA